MKPILYSHGGSKNHGCEAIVRTFAIELANVGPFVPTLVSMRASDDRLYQLDAISNIIDHASTIKKWSIDFIKAYLMNRIFQKFEYLDCLQCVNVIKQFKTSDVAFSIGGDNYSYHLDPSHIYLHDLYRKHGMKTILWACSINPELVKHPKILADLNNFDCITARESITYSAMLNCGIKNVYLIPDLAFILPKQACDQSNLITKSNFIGINLSPLVIDYNKSHSLILSNYRQLINYVLAETNYKIALIPHVVWDHNDDRKAMQPLYDEFKKTGRIVQIHDHNCMELKDIIARCRFFIGARTHATIAAYSTCVPTIVLGYSVKAKGIAKDIFGTYENYVLPVQSINSANCLTESFKWMQANEQSILEHYEKVMPSYIESVHKSQEILKQYLITNE